MNQKFYCKKHFFSITIIALFLSGVSPISAQQYNFSHSNLGGATFSASPTSLQFGPDNRLYVAQQSGLIKVFTVVRNGINNYSVTKTETISLINKIPNNNDDGTANLGVITRQITGILVKGTAANPVIYVSSSDSRIGGPSGDLNLDTNSGIISTLSWNGSTWVKMDLVRGLPRSEENHASNGMQLNSATNMLYVAQGGHTNGGSPSTNFAFTTEYALSAAILSIDLTAINKMTTKGSGYTTYKYDLPTLDDPTRANNSNGTDINDPFGGNDGLNQAKIAGGINPGPVQVFAPGFRNPFDFLITKAGKMYSIDNGGNQGWGGYPQNEGTANVTNDYVSGEPGSSSPSSNEATINNLDNLHYIGDINTYKPNSFYGGHPNPVRANPNGAGLFTRSGTTGVFRTSKSGANPLPADWPPVPVANPIEGDFQMPGVEDNAILTFISSTNGLTEYTASNFNNSLKGSLLACSYDGYIDLIRLTSDGTNVTNSRRSSDKVNQDPSFATNFGTQPLDIVAKGDNDVFPGTVWVTLYGTKAIAIFEPKDIIICTGAHDSGDDDADRYTNADEMDNGSNACSQSSVPPDNDLDYISDMNDPDDDNDGIDDTKDLFPLDKNNGLKTTTPITYDLFNNYPGTGFFGLGFTGLMTNKNTNYANLFAPKNLIAGGAVGAFTIAKVSGGDALGTLNTQENAFQFGLKPANTSPYSIETRMTSPFFNNSPQYSQSQGIYIGTGDEDNYLKVALTSTGFEVICETAGNPVITLYTVAGAASSQTVDVFLSVDPVSGQVQPKYALDKGQAISLGSPIAVSGALLSALQGGTSAPAFAVGIIATSGSAASFAATWDYINVISDGTTGIEVSTFTLIDATTDQDITTLTDGAVIDLSTIQGKSINIRANTTPSTVGSVAFDLNGNPARIETGAPYALYGDNNFSGDYNPWTPNVGSYTLKATPYSAGNATGIPGTPLMIKFSVVDPTAANSPVTFTLVNATTDADIQPLNNGANINLSAIQGGSINIRANSSTTVGSIVFNLTGKQIKNQTESTAPYALFGDVSGNYNNWTPAVGSYNLTGKPYSGSGGTGTAGIPLMIGFTVTKSTVMTVNRSSKASEPQAIPQPALALAKAYPNPSDKGRFTVLLPAKFEGEVSYSLMSLAGNKLTGGKLFLKKPASVLTFDFSREMIVSGLYYLQLENKEQKANAGLIKSK